MNTMHPITVNHSNTLYLLKDQMESAGSPCDIVKYNLVTKTIGINKNA